MDLGSLMITTSHTNTSQKQILAFSALVALLASTALIGSSPATPVAAADQADALARGLSPALRAAALEEGGPVRIRLLLTDNTLVARLRGEEDALSGRMRGAAVARAAAQTSPKVITSTEIEAGHEMDAERNEAIGVIKRAASPGARQNARVADLVREHGGVVESAMPIPNQVVAVVPRAELVELSQSPDVYRVEAAQRPEWQNSTVDGSPTWQANGYTGNGTSADNVGGPDFAEIDTGIRTTHVAFRSRVPGDCATCPGSGPSRVTSPALRTDFSGGTHGNEIAATVASTDLTYDGSTGMAYGLDKLEDASDAKNPYYWIIGQPYNNEAGVADLPENVDYSAGIYEDTVDYNTSWTFFDALADRLGISMAISAGNCGIATNTFTGCSDGPHRVSTPATDFNTIAVGGLSVPNVNDESTWIPWANSSPGPTWGGRKKPDLIALPGGASDGPSSTNDTDYVNPGIGTSFSAPQVSGGAILLASVGVYAPTAQKAIMINSARPIQGQTYWTPTTGWGALNMDTAFYDRGNYANGNITPFGDNGVRFYRQTGVTAGDRTTLTWNRRTTGSLPLGTSYYALTNLDLEQVSQGTGATTASGGSDAGDNVDTNPTISAANPMPGNGADGGDNVEQVRSTASGTQILKVKAMSAIAGATSEPYSIAAHHPLTALQTPIPTVALSSSPAAVGLSQEATVTATVTNPSSDLPLSSPSVQLTLPPDVDVVSGTNPQPVSPSGTTVVSWTIAGSVEGTAAISATATGSTYGETFSGSGSTTVDIDSSPPTISINPLPLYSETSNPTASWSATDSVSGVENYDVDQQVDLGPWIPVISAGNQTSVALSGSEGQTITIRVRARDAAGNVSDWSQTQTTIDAIPPEITFGAPTSPSFGTLSVPTSVTNVGAPIVAATYTFNTSEGGSFGALQPAAIFRNLGTKTIRATLTVRATDAAGRNVLKAQDYDVPPRWIPAQLSISKPSKKRGRLTVSGKVAKGYAKQVTVSVKRRHRKGAKTITRKVTPKGGRYSVTLKLGKGSYSVKAATSTNGQYLATTESRTATVR